MDTKTLEALTSPYSGMTRTTAQVTVLGALLAPYQAAVVAPTMTGVKNFPFQAPLVTFDSSGKAEVEAMEVMSRKAEVILWQRKEQELVHDYVTGHDQYALTEHFTALALRGWDHDACVVLLANALGQLANHNEEAQERALCESAAE